MPLFAESYETITKKKLNQNLLPIQFFLFNIVILC